MAKAHVYQAVVRGKIHGQDYRNVFHFGSDTVVSDGDLNDYMTDLALALLQCFTSVLLPALPSSFTLEGVAVKRVYPAVSDEVMSVTGAGPGAVGTDSLPSFNSAKFEILTGGGRVGRGRKFLPPFPAANINDSSGLDPATLAVVVAFLACVVGKFVGAGKSEDWTLGVLSRKLISTGSNMGAAFKDARSLVATENLAVIGRRKVGRGS